ncbi:AraC family transcriptional regulator [Neobacillus bataviensis LMG 21833]|uniref:AraC family transcriptional regulator n=1 Tax=Neobacillus bataviensis LMG 21833 TaxID=1117379 RepID=K6D2R4_9BACI|nr:helix-turn-helix domain-containing protein [Neobacillus bataviensis]EKN62499.1 AraC family transcriptional regulator [Neobacillus bataviensis LMG 21833]
MYNVMLVDDDYPVLEFLSEMIDWDGLGLTLQSTHVNGMSALKEAAENMPDILITDIGMPKLNGIELTKKLKEKNPALLVTILSCHSEFGFAQQALKLNVQEYILKDMLDVNEMIDLLRQFVDKLNNEKKNKINQLKMAQTIEQNKGLMLEKFINKTINHPIHNKKDWQDEAYLLGLQPNQRYMVILCLINQYQSVLHYFQSTDLLNFFVQNVIAEVIENEAVNAVHGQFEKEKSFLFVSLNMEEEVEILKIKGLIKKIQIIFQDTFGISFSFRKGNAAEKPIDIKLQMMKLIEFNVSKICSNIEIENACKYILDNLHRKITLDEVANYLHLNSSYFSRLFKKEIGENFVKYVVKLKMNRAKDLLDQTNYTILEISEMLGYENQSYFNKTFKSFEGLAPIEYRNGKIEWGNMNGVKR